MVPVAQPLPKDALIERVRHFEARFQVADNTAAVTERLLELLKNYKPGRVRIAYLIRASGLFAALEIGMRCIPIMLD
jgi:hypothetical protein